MPAIDGWSRATLGLLGAAVLAVSALAAGCAGSKPAPATPAAVERVAPARQAEDETARKAREEAAREAAAREADAAAARRASEEAARQARQFAPVYFDYDSDAIRDDQRQALADAAQRLLGARFRATLEGHCDERGTTAYNLALGQKRADRVRTFLLRTGVPAERLATISYGEERPADMRRDEAGWAKNRRVEFAVAD